MTLVRGCARCGGVHEVDFKRLTNPIEAVDHDEVVYTHWAPCPTNGEPILMRKMPIQLPG